MNNKTLFIIGLFICLLFTIPMVSAADADSNLIDNSVIGTNINSQAITTSDASIDHSSNANAINTNINSDDIVSNNNNNNSIIDINDSDIESQKDGSSKNIIKSTNKNTNDSNNETEDNILVTDINLGKNNKNSNDKNILSANALTADGTGTTFGDLQYIIDQDTTGTITLDKNYKFESGTDDAYLDGITINKAITINGGNHTIDGDHLARIFNINTGSASDIVVLNSIHFINGMADGSGDNANGGAIYIGSPTTLNYITAINCTATGNGGAIYAHADGTNIAANYLYLYNNTAVNGGALYVYGNDYTVTVVDARYNSASGNGGAMYAYGNSFHLNKVNFINNTAYGEDSEGGAIFFAHNSDDSIVNNSYFANNSANRDGGAIVWDQGAHFGELYNSKFYNNTANHSSGAVRWSGENGTIDNCSFIDNKAYGTNLEPGDFDQGGDQILGGNGGAITWLGSVGIIRNSNFTDNYAEANGGGMFLIAFDINDPNSICNDTHIINCNFISNDAGLNGGALDWDGKAYNGSVSGSKFYNNTAARSGGAIFWKGNGGIITQSDFKYNSANGTHLVQPEGFLTPGGNGGAVIITGSDVNITYSNFTNNSARARGGAVYLQLNNNTMVLNSSFENNSAGTNGGALDFYTGAENGKVINSTFLNNTANRSGGGIYWNGEKGVINGSIFYDNKALNQGTYVNGSQITDGGDGGAIIWTGSHGTLENSTFKNNNATNRGGAIFLEKHNLEDPNDYCKNITVLNCTFEKNSAGTNGGAIDWFEGAENGRIINSTFTENYARRSGGAVFWNGVNGTISNSTFTLNEVGLEGADTGTGETIPTGDDDGGAIKWTGANGLIENSIFRENKALEGRGGAIYLENNENGTVNNCTFELNSAFTNGGAIDWHEGAKNGQLINSTLTNNTAGRSGGAVYWNGHNGTINGTNFTDNKALGTHHTEGQTEGGDGGAIIWTGSYGTIELSNFHNNSARWRGGAIFLQKNVHEGEEHCYNTTVKNSYFEENFAGSNGGAIDWSAGAMYGKLINSTFINNTAERSAGAVYWNGLYGEILNSTFENNTAIGNFTHDVRPEVDETYTVIGGNGGAVVITGSHAKIDGSNFTFNTATRLGGAIFFHDNTNGTINNSIFTNNTAGLNGGALDFYEGARDGQVLNSTFINNTAKDGKGGAINWIGTNGTVDGCDFINNTANGSDDESGAGGAINVDGINTYIANSTFTNNSCWDDGGAICWNGDLGKIYNITCFNNSAIGKDHKSSGGTISIYGSNLTMDKVNITLGTVSSVNDDKVSKGGGIFVTGNYVNITNAEFTNCSALAPIDDSSAGALYIIGNNTNVVNATFKNNTAYEDGGAVYILGENCTLNNTLFLNNVAHNDGGAIQWDGNNGRIYNLTADGNYADSASGSSKGGTLTIEGNNTVIQKINISNSYVDSDHDLGAGKSTQGGAIFLTGNDCNITDAVFDNCSVKYVADESSGGAMYIIGNNTNVVNANFTNNSAVEDGGAIYIDGDYCTLNNTVFINNTAHNDGGAVDWEGNYGHVYNLTAIDNHADSAHGSSKGGTILLEGGHCTFDQLNISNSYVSGETYTGTKPVQGGGIAISGNDCNISNSVFDNCSVRYEGTNSSGGALYIWGNDTHIANCNFTNNSVPSDGGAIYVGGSDVTVVDSNFIDNNASQSGGAIFLTDNKNSQINGSTFKNNSAKVNGGAIDFYAGAEDGLVSACEFVNNTAGASGGSIYWEGTRGVIEYSSFDGSRALGNQTSDANNGRGGSIIWLGDHGTIRGCDFNDSQSAKEGATLYVVGDLIKVQQSNFTNSQTNTSGGIYIQGSEGTISNCHMENTTAKESGGALYVKGNYIYLLDSDINNATSVNNGSAIYITGNTTHIENSNVTNCSSSSGNGTIMIAGYKTVMDGVNVDNNKAVSAGAVLISGSQTKISNSNFTHNNASKDAGGIMINGTDNTITTSNISDNYAKENGGGIYYTGDRNTVSYSNIDHNSANNGANVYMAIKAKDCKLIGSNITNAKARNFGGGVEWCENSENGLIQDCYFYNCTSTAHGGAIHWYPGKYGVIDNCTFVECHVAGTKNGGAIYAGANTNVKPVGTVLSNSTFINCTTGTRGAVNWNSQGGLIYNNTFINCGVANTSVTTSWGGAQALQIEKGNNTQIIACEFYNCSGIGGGGALRVQGDGHSGYNITIANCTFDNCNNTGLAGGVYLSDMARNITFENNTFTNNSAPNVGAFFMDPKTVIVSFVNNTFINNSATGSSGYAGAAQLTGNLEVINSTFIENSAVSKAGAINAVEDYDGNNNLAIIGSTFQYNKAKEGSAINAINLDMTDTVLLENQAAFDKWTNQRNSRANGHVSINGTFVGKDNYLNGIKANGATFDNVTYCGVNGGGLYEDTVTNTDDVTSAKSTNEVHQLIVLEIYDYNNNLVDTKTTFTDENGKFNFEFDMENPQDYSYKVIHPEDNYYTGAEYSIGKAISNITIKSQNITHPEDENITFKVTGGSGTPTGNITVFINDTEGNVIFNDTIILNSTGEAKLFFPRLNASEYYIEAKYNGDNNYLPDNDTSIFHVNMAESFIKIGIENYTYNETRNITITVPYIESGRISVIVTNENFTQLYTVYVNEGTEEVQIQLPILDAGVYDIEAIFHGNNNYYPSQNTTNFTVFKAASIINITADNVSGGVRETVDIHIDPEVATQNINLTVYDAQGNIVDQYYDLGLHDSRITQILTLLPKGKYNVTVTYPGDKNHNASSNSTIFYVTNDLFPIEINATNMTYGDDQIINITVPANADPDKLYININCSDWPGNKTVTELGLTIDENGLIQIDTTNTNLFANKIDAGNYTINVYYPGDDDFLSNSSSVDFEVAKAIPEMNVTPTNITYGNLEDILVEIAQNGNVTLYVTSENDPTLNITKIEVEIIEGKVYWNVNDTYLPAGEYMVEAIFNGNRNYESVNKTEKFNVTKAIPNIVIDVDDIHVGDSEYINVTVEGVEHGTTPQGNIKIIVRTIDQIVELNATGQYNLTLDDEVQGNGISVTVIYYGDDNYNYTEKSVYYDVTKKETSINVTGATPISYGTIENLLAEVNETGVTGTITIYVNSTVDGFINQTHVATITVDDAGKATWDIDQIILPVGSYDVTAVYSGDDKFEGSVSTVKVIVVEKATDYDISVEANNTVYGTDQVIIVTVPDNANGTVTITIEGTEISLTSQVENGKAVFTIPNDLVDFLEVHDNYNVTATYNGDDKYAAGVKASDLFNVTKAESHIKVVAEDIDYTQIENITVILPDFNATGKIVITIVNKSDTTQIVRTLEVDPFTNTTGVIYPFEGLLVGNYTVKVEYSGDHNYNNSENTTDFEVRKVDPTLTENSPDIIYGADENITVTITGATGGVDPTGTIQVIVDGVTIDTITIGDKDLEFIVTKPGVDPQHNITVIYSGDSNYNPVTITGEFAVTQNNTIEMEEVSPNIVYGNNEIITITLPNDATGTVYLVVNGTYYTPIGIDENHQAVFTIVAPIVGEYNFTAYYSGDENYTANNISGAFNVTKADVSLSESHTATITYGANDTITVTITGVEGPEGVLAPTGTIKVLVDGEEIGNVTIGDDLVFNSIRPFVDPQHNITIIYSGDNNYNSKVIDNTVLDTLVFEVIKNNTLEISEDSPDIFYTENETITVTIAGDATGTITVTVGGEQVGEVVTITEITEDDKVFTFNITKPEGGVYDDLTVVYSGDSNYDSATINGEFTVSPIDPNITEDSPDIVYTNNEVITITVPEGATGNLTVTVKNSKGDTVETKKLVIGTDDLVVTIEKPAVDNYTFTVDYTGCTNYTEKTITGEFKVTKASNEITVVSTNITYGQTETITVTVPEGATGNVTITVGTYTDMLEIPEGSTEVVFTIPKTAADELLSVSDNYIVFANYSGDSNYESVVANAPFHVDPANTTLTIEVADITYGEDEIINVTVNGVTGGDIPTGFVTIKLNGTDIELTKPVDSEGKVQFNVSGLVVGEYTVNATFVSSSINYNDSNNTAKFNVTKADVKEANMNITAINITYGDDETITVILNETNITGNVTITINGTEIETKELVDGKVVFTVPDLEVNGYNVVANYSGDHNYNAIPIGANFNTDFKVDKANVTVVVTPVDIIYKETEEINVTVTGVFINDNVNDNLTGKVTIYIDGVENQTKDISAVDEYGILHFSVEGLAVGTHNVTAVYHDDRNYNDNNATEDFEVINALPEDMKVIPQNITYHIQTETITVDLGEVLNGTVQLYINDTLVATFEVIDQRTVSYTNNSLAVGNYTAKAVFTANGDFVNASANFTVSKAPVTVDVVAEDSVYGETQTITVNVDNTVPDKYNLTGNVSITINGVDYGNKTVDANGQAVFEITGLEANDNYQVIATYYNDPNYLDNTGQDTFKVSKADVKDVNKNITAINITYGEDETITVTLNEDNITGKITITINGTEIETKELEDGKVVFTVKDLEVNGYNVVANYSGDTNYNAFTIADNLNTDFTVGKANSTVEVEAIPSIVYGNNETITVSVPIRNHTGTITLTINGSDYVFVKHLTAEDGDTIVLTNVSGLAVGNYNVTVKYSDDRNYNDSEASALFEVTKATPSQITVEAQNITYTEDEIILVTVADENATGSVTITIDLGDSTYTNTTNLDENGQAKFNVTGLVVNHYTVVANYSGDANYTGQTASAPFRVDKAASNVTIDVANITYGEIEYANITIPNYNASGRVIIKVDDKAYDILPINNNTPVKLELDGLAVGTHTIDVEYFDDDNYNKSVAHVEFNVTKAIIPVDPANASSLIVLPTNITYLNNETIVVSVGANNATGKVTITIKDKDGNPVDIDPSVVTSKNITEEGSQSVTFTVPGLAVGNYTVEVDYTDDANYENAQTSAKFIVDPANSTVTVEAVNITYLDNETITVTVPITNASGTVVIKINGTQKDERTVS
ncbi:adhesin-like protein [Methanobrevibacter ruminantium M1]|uniref:Adhesin-like protein n=1 Tax=Methanobrevibacter ruminantium (strain ATCC 35063 / DSM 1093 / JCM 13430 / OCM 146 / M1) TaxID=634498 RepID=D3E2Q2_METRM|nr:Ig-like domain repeat protein [Methanobrevibacter ruminantium]ADC46813.1 adhesin-like protein [Methanobrevibacter ruminantium M1]